LLDPVATPSAAIAGARIATAHGDRERARRGLARAVFDAVAADDVEALRSARGVFPDPGTRFATDWEPPTPQATGGRPDPAGARPAGVGTLGDTR
jgi:hypothetical protein